MEEAEEELKKMRRNKERIQRERNADNIKNKEERKNERGRKKD
jgi:hypothetical protein